MVTMLFALVVLAVIVAAVVFAYDFTALHVEVRPKATGTNATTPTVGGSNNLTYVAVYNNSYVGVYDDRTFIATGQQLSALKVPTRTFVRGGPIMVGPNAGS